MINEWLFFVHCTVIIAFLFLALVLGKEALFAYISSCWLFANFFVTKQIFFFGYETTASDVYAIGAMLGSSVLQELWGKSTANKSIWVSFLVLLLSASMSSLHLLYQPSPYDTMQPHFQEILNTTPRLIVASFITFLVSSRLDIFIFDVLRKTTSIPFAIRSAITTVAVALLDTVLFSWLGLYGLVSSLSHVIFISYLIKLLIIISVSPFLSFINCVSRLRNTLQNTL